MKCSWLTVDALVMSTHFILPIQMNNHFSDMLENSENSDIVWELWHPATYGVPHLPQT